MIVGCYCLDLYCDNETAHRNEFPMLIFETTGRSLAGCLRRARRAGWSIDLTKRKARCPKCRGVGLPSNRAESDIEL